jgi:DNA-binding transcriptional regulator YbjK
MTRSASPSGRRDDDRKGRIADAAILVIARDGLRGLTHRAVDRQGGLPQGSTSYYARTRRELVALVVTRLAARTRTDVDQEGPSVVSTGAATTPEAAARMLAHLVELFATRSTDHRARFALLVDLADDDELHALITTKSPIRERLVAGNRALLEGLGVRDAQVEAARLVAVVDGLLFQRLAGSLRGPSAREDVETVLTDYLRAVVARSTRPGHTGAAPS